MTTAAIVSKLWNYCNVLRDDGMSYGDYPSTSLRAGSEQLTFLLFLKMADERTKPPYNQPSAVPAKYNWPTLLKKDGDDLFDHYRHMLESLGNEKGLLGLIFNKSQNKFQDPSKLRRLVVDLIDTAFSAIAFTLGNSNRQLVATRPSPSSLNSSPSR